MPDFLIDVGIDISKLQGQIRKIPGMFKNVGMDPSQVKFAQQLADITLKSAKASDLKGAADIKAAQAANMRKMAEQGMLVVGGKVVTIDEQRAKVAERVATAERNKAKAILDTARADKIAAGGGGGVPGKTGGGGRWAPFDNTSIIGSTGNMMLFAAQWRLLYAAQNLVVGGFKSAISNSIKFEYEMAVLRRQLGDTEVATRNLAYSIVDMSLKYGQSVHDVITITTEWAKQGKSAQEAAALTEATLITMAGGFMTQAEATSFLSATLNAFNVDGKNAVSVMDSLVAISKKYTVDANDLAAALTRVSFTAQESGVSLQELEGMIAAVHQTTHRTGEVIGTALRTIMLRFRDPVIMTMLEKVNVQTKNAEGNFLDFGSVMAQLSAQWDNLSEAERQNILKKGAGLRQTETLLALIKGFPTAIEAEGVALNSQGMAAADTAAMMNTAQKQAERLRAAWQSLWISPDSGFFLTLLKDTMRGWADILSATDAATEAKHKYFGGKDVLGETSGKVATAAPPAPFWTSLMPGAMPGVGARVGAVVEPGSVAPTTLGIMSALSQLPTGNSAEDIAALQVGLLRIKPALQEYIILRQQEVEIEQKHIEVVKNDGTALGGLIGRINALSTTQSASTKTGQAEIAQYEKRAESLIKNMGAWKEYQEMIVGGMAPLDAMKNIFKGLDDIINKLTESYKTNTSALGAAQVQQALGVVGQNASTVKSEILPQIVAASTPGVPNFANKEIQGLTSLYADVDAVIRDVTASQNLLNTEWILSGGAVGVATDADAKQLKQLEEIEERYTTGAAKIDALANSMILQGNAAAAARYKTKAMNDMIVQLRKDAIAAVPSVDDLSSAVRDLWNKVSKYLAGDDKKPKGGGGHRELTGAAWIAAERKKMEGQLSGTEAGIEAVGYDIDEELRLKLEARKKAYAKYYDELNKALFEIMKNGKTRINAKDMEGVAGLSEFLGAYREDQLSSSNKKREDDLDKHLESYYKIIEYYHHGVEDETERHRKQMAAISFLDEESNFEYRRTHGYVNLLKLKARLTEELKAAGIGQEAGGSLDAANLGRMGEEGMNAYLRSLGLSASQVELLNEKVKKYLETIKEIDAFEEDAANRQRDRLIKARDAYKELKESVRSDVQAPLMEWLQDYEKKWSDVLHTIGKGIQGRQLQSAFKAVGALEDKYLGGGLTGIMAAGFMPPEEAAILEGFRDGSTLTQKAIELGFANGVDIYLRGVGLKRGETLPGIADYEPPGSMPLFPVGQSRYAGAGTASQKMLYNFMSRVGTVRGSSGGFFQDTEEELAHERNQIAVARMYERQRKLKALKPIYMISVSSSTGEPAVSGSSGQNSAVGATDMDTKEGLTGGAIRGIQKNFFKDFMKNPKNAKMMGTGLNTLMGLGLTAMQGGNMGMAVANAMPGIGSIAGSFLPIPGGSQIGEVAGLAASFIMRDMFKPKEKTKRTQVSITHTEEAVSSKLDLSNRELSIANRHLSAIKESLQTFAMPDSYYFRERIGRGVQNQTLTVQIQNPDGTENSVVHIVGRDLTIAGMRGSQ